MEIIPSENSLPCTSYVFGIGAMEEVRSSTTLEVVHSIDVALGGRQWQTSHIPSRWRYCCLRRPMTCIVSLSVRPQINIATGGRRNPRQMLKSWESTKVRNKSPSLLYLVPVTNCSKYVSCRVLSTFSFSHTHAHLSSTLSFTSNMDLRWWLQLLLYCTCYGIGSPFRFWGSSHMTILYPTLNHRVRKEHMKQTKTLIAKWSRCV